MSTLTELLAAADALADICEQSPCGACPAEDPCGQCCEDAAVARYRALRAAQIEEMACELRGMRTRIGVLENTAQRDLELMQRLNSENARLHTQLKLAYRQEDDIERARRLVGNPTHPSAESPPPLTP